MAGPASFLKDDFQRFYDSRESPRVARAPGRVNLIGEHTDYNLGFVLPIAIDLACYTMWASADGGRLRVYSENLSESREWAVADLATVSSARDWGDYVAGVAREILRAGYSLSGKDLLIHSTVPVGSGLSSSAALEVSVALALLGDQAIDRLSLVQLCHRAETEFVGLPCGIMDQYVAVFGRDNAAIEIDCRTYQHQAVALPDHVAILAVNTMVKHDLGSSAYRERVSECQQAVNAIQQRHPLVKSLRDANESHLETLGIALPDNVLRRAKHVITENRRVKEFVTACERRDVAIMGRLFVESHRSLQRDYEVSCEELDFLVDTALSLPGVHGARMTGGGFGGCTVNLVAAARADDFAEEIRKAYRERFAIEAQVYRCRASAGASG